MYNRPDFLKRVADLGAENFMGSHDLAFEEAKPFTKYENNKPTDEIGGTGVRAAYLGGQLEVRLPGVMPDELPELTKGDLIEFEGVTASIWTREGSRYVNISVKATGVHKKGGRR